MAGVRSDGDIMQVTSKASLFGSACHNVWFFVADYGALVPSYEAFVEEFKDQTLTPLLAYQGEDYIYSSIEVKNLTNGLDVEEFGYAETGTTESTTETALVAYSFKLQRTNLLTRSGGKRIGGVPEAAYDNDVISYPPEDIAIMEAAVAAILTATEGGAAGTWSPVIIGRTLEVVDGEDTWPLDLAKVNPVSSAILRTRLSSQVSRKRRSTS